ncbi:MAG: type II toxin-antitoxin system Phd/YefM family antitoxin [Planctomycetes bacterium]|nr:type II toxin-antitoxin system Phd/YefM family antitoxin [Planctomycetota bacterium]
MVTMAAKEAKNSFGVLIDVAQREPVTVEKKGRPVAVMISKHDFDAMQTELDEYRSMKETEYLLSTAKNKERLLESIEEAKKGNLKEIELEDL